MGWATFWATFSQTHLVTLIPDRWCPGLPDFSWYKIPKREKYTKLPRTIPNVHKIYITKDHKMDQYTQHLPLQDPPKFTQI
jgi:hypothetical protein